MLIIKIGIFGLLIISVKTMFILFFQDGDKKIGMMREISDFIEFLRIYSCLMKMSFEEILSNYNFKHENIKLIFYELLHNLKEENSEEELNSIFEKFIYMQIKSPEEFNVKVSKILDFYGSSMADVLDNKLSFLKNDIDKFIDKYEDEYKERKNLLNKLSLLIGCLIATVLI